MTSLPAEEPLTKEGIQLRRRMAEMERRYALLMPIDAQDDSSWCRDKFLKQLFAEVNLGAYESEPSSSSRSSTDSFSGLLSGDSAAPMSLAQILRDDPKLIRTTRMLDKIDLEGIYADEYMVGAMSGRIEMRYNKLLKSMERASLFFMFARVINRLRIMQSISLDWGGKETGDLPHGLFTWSMDELFKRAKLPDDVYLDVLTLSYSSEVLDWAKFSVDLMEILRYFKYFYTEMYHNTNYNKMMILLWDQQQLLNIADQLDKDLNVTIKEFHNADKRARVITKQLIVQLMRNTAQRCKESAMQARVLLPIEWRYICNYYASLVEMQSLRGNQSVLELEQQIEQLKENMEKEESSARTELLVYDMIINNYHNRYYYVLQKHSDDLEDWENKIYTAKLHLNRARDNVKDIREKIEFMRKRISVVINLIIAENNAKKELYLSSLEPKEPIIKTVRRKSKKTYNKIVSFAETPRSSEKKVYRKSKAILKAPKLTTK